MNNHQNLWNWLVISPNSKFGVHIGSFYVIIGGWKMWVKDHQQLEPRVQNFVRRTGNTLGTRGEMG
jgi:hypothetical protein